MNGKCSSNWGRRKSEKKVSLRTAFAVENLAISPSLMADGTGRVWRRQSPGPPASLPCVMHTFSLSWQKPYLHTLRILSVSTHCAYELHWSSAPTKWSNGEGESTKLASKGENRRGIEREKKKKQKKSGQLPASQSLVFLLRSYHGGRKRDTSTNFFFLSLYFDSTRSMRQDFLSGVRVDF